MREHPRQFHTVNATIVHQEHVNKFLTRMTSGEGGGGGGGVVIQDFRVPTL